MTTTATHAATLIRTIDGVEWPAAGPWDIRPGRPLDVRRLRGLRRRGDRTGGYHGELVIAAPGLGSTLHLVIDAAPAPRLPGVDVQATITAADELGSWQLAGTALAADDLVDVHGVATYHGVFHAGARVNTWLDLDLVLDRPRRRGTRRLAVSGQLTALAPDGLAHPR
jgi:hypothetical protein